MNERILIGVMALALAAVGGACDRRGARDAGRDNTGRSRAARGPARASKSDTPPPAPPDPAAPNLLLITIDTLRVDHLGCYGYFRSTSPTIDRLAGESVVFENCIAPVAQTLPTHTSILTGVYPYEHGFRANIAKLGGTWIPSPILKTFATALGERGYTTAGFVSAAPVKRVTGIAAGFSAWDEPTEKKRRADATTDRVVAWLASGPSEPWFVWIHYFDCHAPYEPLPPYDTLFRTDERLEAYLKERRFADSAPKRFRTPRGREGIRIKDTRVDHNLYDGELRTIDDQLARVFDVLRRRGLWDALPIVLTADHGEALGQHGREGHGYVWREQLHVPLLMRVPGRGARRVASPISSVDILPTLLGMVDHVPAGDFLAQCTGMDVQVFSGARVIYSQTPAPLNPGKPIIHVLMRDDWRLIRRADGHDELFNLGSDPYELHDVAAGEPARVAALRLALADIVSAQKQRGRDNRAGQIRREEPEQRRALEALGYLGDQDDE